MSGSRRSRNGARAMKVALVGLVASVALGLTGCVPPKSYVALGDSYSAGPLIPVQQGDPAGCLRSDSNYAHVVRPRLTLPAFRDVSCSGAETKDMTAAQAVSGGSNPPEFNALDVSTTAVSLTIGGNDIGFTSIIADCFSATDSGTPCKNKYLAGGRDEISARISAAAPKVKAVLQGIRSRSPNATVFLLAYLDILPDDGSNCFPQMPITSGDAPYLRDKENELNSVLRFVAGANGATFVDTYTPSIGRDACKSPTLRWVEPISSVNAAPVHPNAAGMSGAATVLLAAMRQKGL